MQLKEIRDILISSIVLAFVFSYRGVGNLSNTTNLAINFLISIVVVSAGFVLHELAHRYFARKYGAHAEFQMWPFGLLIALGLIIVSNGNFTFAAPGAVMIYPKADLWGNTVNITEKKMGIISVAGPATNIILAGVFIIANYFYHSNILILAASVNAFLALFNMIPIHPLDGAKVIFWDKRIWLLVILISLGMLFLA